MFGDDKEDAPRPNPLNRTWPQRLIILVASGAAVMSFATAGIVWFAQQRLEERQLVELDATAVASNPLSLDGSEGDTGGGPGAADASSGGSDGATAIDPLAPVETFPSAEPAARNILITGADNNACLDPDSRFAPAFGDRGEGFGERSDTIMMWRVNPGTSQVAVLSFPRDLWLNIAGRSSKGRINEAYRRDDPQRLIDTIRQNFGIETDHFIQVDFCAFKELVDALDGVAVPFATPVRDGATGLAVPEAGCFTFTGEHALAYVRSRKIEFQNADGIWERDPTSDLGRISRQQDFIRRVGDELLSNAFSPSVVRSLFNVSSEYIVTDNGLALDKVLELSGVLQNSDPANITTYQIEARGTTIQGNSVLEPRIGGENMQAVLALFRGEATLTDRPEQVLESGNRANATVPATTVPVLDPDTTTTTAPGDEPVTTEEAVPFETLPEVDAENNVFGVIPDATVSCT